MKHWHRKQKKHHKKLYLEYRKEDLIWHLDLFLSVNHPEWAVKGFIEDFVNDKKTVAQMFAMAIVCGGQVWYFEEFPYKSDMDRVIGFMRYRQYIKITPNMHLSDIIKLDRCFDLTPQKRFELREKLLP